MLQIKQWTSNDMLMVVSLRNQTIINHHQVRGSYTNSIHGLLGLPSSPWIPTPWALPETPFVLKNTNIIHVGIFGLDKLCLCQRFGHVTQMQRGLEIQLRHPDGSHCKRRGLSIQGLEKIQVVVDTIDDTSCCSYMILWVQRIRRSKCLGHQKIWYCNGRLHVNEQPTFLIQSVCELWNKYNMVLILIKMQQCKNSVPGQSS